MILVQSLFKSFVALLISCTVANNEVSDNIRKCYDTEPQVKLATGKHKNERIKFSLKIEKTED